jgi:hypothetical protein
MADLDWDTKRRAQHPVTEYEIRPGYEDNREGLCIS